MAITKEQFERANERMAIRREGPIALAARYDAPSGRIIVSLNRGVEFIFPTSIAEGLAGADPADLAEIEVSPAGLGLHWPRLDVDLLVSGLLSGVFGSRRWMAAELGATGGRSRSPAKRAASRENGRLGGRPRKKQAG
jgi:hypothetical protein